MLRKHINCKTVVLSSCMLIGALLSFNKATVSATATTQEQTQTTTTTTTAATTTVQTVNGMLSTGLSPAQ